MIEMVIADKFENVKETRQGVLPGQKGEISP